jgi:hypothetical protein
MSAPRTTSMVALTLASALLGCDSDGGDGAEGGDPHYVFASIVSSGEEANTYVSLLESLDGQTVDNDKGREFPGTSDVWVFDGFVFIADQESQTITKFSVNGRKLVEQARIGFSDYGLTDFGFWVNTFVDSHKAYLANAPTEYIIWDPAEMRITGSISIPEIAPLGRFEPYTSYTDRSAVVRDGLFYHPIYFADDTFFEYAPESRIVVVDTASDEVVDILDAPCPGLDYATKLDNGDLYFSTWVFAPAGAAVIDGPATCVVKVPADKPRSVELAFQVKDVTGGREGGAFRYLGDGRALLSVLHDDEAAEKGETDLEGVGYGPYWRFWSFDTNAQSATLLEEFGWNGGAAYSASARGHEYMLVPAGDYTSTEVYDLSTEALPRVLETQGWALRLFALDP